jgi:hypothetical protein
MTKPAQTRASGSNRGNEEGLQAGKLEGLKKSTKCKTSYPKSGGDSTAAHDPKARKPFRKFSNSRRASITLNEAYRLARWRRANGVILDPNSWLFILAAILASAEPERIHVGYRPRIWHGLDWPNLERALEEANIGNFSEHEMETVFNAVRRWHDKNQGRFISGSAIGRHLGVSSLERDELRLRQILPTDMTPKERAARQQERKRQTEKERMRTVRAGKHAPRVKYLEQAERRRKFCQEHGISDRTVTRWIKNNDLRVRSLLAQDIYNTGQPTDFGHRAEGLQAAMSEGPARTDRQILSHGAGVASPLGFPEGDQEGLPSNQKEDGACQTQPHPGLAHLPDPWLTADGQVVGPWWEPRTVPLKPGFPPGDARALPMSWRIPLAGRILAVRAPAVETVTPEGLPVCRLPPLHDGREVAPSIAA